MLGLVAATLRLVANLLQLGHAPLVFALLRVVTLVVQPVLHLRALLAEGLALGFGQEAGQLATALNFGAHFQNIALQRVARLVLFRDGLVGRGHLALLLEASLCACVVCVGTLISRCR